MNRRERFAAWVIFLGFRLMPHRSKGIAIVIDDGEGTQRCQTQKVALPRTASDFLISEWTGKPKSSNQGEDQ